MLYRVKGRFNISVKDALDDPTGTSRGYRNGRDSLEKPHFVKIDRRCCALSLSLSRSRNEALENKHQMVGSRTSQPE